MNIRRELPFILSKFSYCYYNKETGFNININLIFSGGGSNCSVFCALNILLEQFKNEQTVDVCRTVKKLKTQRPHMIETYVSEKEDSLIFIL